MDTPMPHPRRLLHLLSLVAPCAHWALAGATLPPDFPAKSRPARPDNPAAAAFLKALASSSSTPEERRAAWEPLSASRTPPPRAVARAVDKARERAWKQLDELIRSPAVKQAASGLHRAIAPRQPGARDAVCGGSFGKETLDGAMAPIEQALDDAIGPLREAEAFPAIRTRIDELEGYAVGCGLRFGWHAELLDTLCTLRFVARYAGKPSWLEIVDGNYRLGACIDPGEHTCIARLNWHRILLGLPPARTDLRLVVAARKHSEEMVAKGYFSHESPTPALKGFGARAAREHTGARGECIAAGSGSGLGVFGMWYYSQGHHKIMIGAGPAIGVGRCQGKWTLMMGGSRMSGPTASKMGHYVRERYRAGDDAGKLLALARWCAETRLYTQAQDELLRVLALDPDNQPARAALDRIRGRAKPRNK
jgi:hypothetical protein